MSKLVEFTDVRFSDLNPNSYYNLNNMKLDLSVFTSSVNFSANNQSLQLWFRNQDDCKFIPSVLLCIF